MRSPSLLLAALVALAASTSRLAAQARRRPGTLPRAATRPESTYFGVQVDTLAEPDPATMIPRYPPALRARGVRGSVLAQFVVDTAGRVDMRTFKVLASTDTAFSLAVRAALVHAEFLPALLDGRKVRQLVEQPFSFGVEQVVRPTAPATTAPPPRR